MNVKKFFVKSFVLMSAMSALLTTGISAYATTPEPIEDFYWYTHTEDKDYSSMDCNIDSTTLRATKSNYYNSYKWVRFSILRMDNDGSFHTIDSKEATGTSTTVSTPSLPMNSSVARRIHKAKLYKTDSNSPVIENFDIRYDKS